MTYLPRTRYDKEREYYTLQNVDTLYLLPKGVTAIYVLLLDEGGLPFYVGQSRNLIKRFAEHSQITWHFAKFRRPAKVWIAGIVPSEKANPAEQDLITRLSEAGYHLTNSDISNATARDTQRSYNLTAASAEAVKSYSASFSTDEKVLPLWFERWNAISLPAKGHGPNQRGVKFEYSYWGHLQNFPRAKSFAQRVSAAYDPLSGVSKIQLSNRERELWADFKYLHKLWTIQNGSYPKNGITVFEMTAWSKSRTVKSYPLARIEFDPAVVLNSSEALTSTDSEKGLSVDTSKSDSLTVAKSKQGSSKYLFDEGSFPPKVEGRKYIYVLLLQAEENTEKVIPYYVGQTVNLNTRFRSHKGLIWHSSKFERPAKIIVAGQVTDRMANLAEQALITAFSKAGIRLLNVDIGNRSARAVQQKNDLFALNELELGAYLEKDFGLPGLEAWRNAVVDMGRFKEYSLQNTRSKTERKQVGKRLKRAEKSYGRRKRRSSSKKS